MQETVDELIDYECERRGYDPEGVRALLFALRVARILRFMREYGHQWEYDVQLPGYDTCEADMSRWTRVSVVGE